MATTYLQAINQVLEKIGEDQIPSGTTQLTETYHLLVGSFVQDIKEQIEDAHNWRSLRSTLSVTIAANAQSGPITGTNERSRLLRLYQQNQPSQVPLVFDVTTSSDPTPLMEIDLAELIYRDTMDPDSREELCYFAIDYASDQELDLYVFPRPSSQRTIQVTMIVPQDRFADTDVSTEIKIPMRPLRVGATWYALEERGEELGTNGMFNEQRFKDALADAIARDEAEQGSNVELVAT